jgi:hypothetical protein
MLVRTKEMYSTEIRFVMLLHTYQHTIFHSGSMSIATLMKLLSRNGTRASTPQAEVALFALKQSYKCRAFI